VEAHEAAGLAEDEVVEKLDAEELAGGGETPRKGDVLGARLGIAAWVRVRREDRRASGQDRRLENFARLCGGPSYVG
jgi:hypothetical protein